MKKFVSRAKYLWDKSIELNKDKKILDCASGNGSQTSQHWLEWEVSPDNITAIDVNQECLDTLSDLGVKTIRMDLEKESISDRLGDEKYDVIICSETLEHLQKETADNLLIGFLKVLNVGGSLVITYPAKAGKHKFKYGHCRQPNDTEIIEVVGECFESMESSRWFVTERHPNEPACFLMFTGKKND